MEKRCIVVAALAVAPFAASAQQAQRAASADAATKNPAVEYRSAFAGYRPYSDPEVARWRELNEEAGRLGGHVGHVPQQPGIEPKPAAKPPAPAGHGAHK